MLAAIVFHSVKTDLKTVADRDCSSVDQLLGRARWLLRQLAEKSVLLTMVVEPRRHFPFYPGLKFELVTSGANTAPVPCPPDPRTCRPRSG